MSDYEMPDVPMVTPTTLKQTQFSEVNHHSRSFSLFKHSLTLPFADHPNGHAWM